jgi:D-aminoacyl-tRNA deacylase
MLAVVQRVSKSSVTVNGSVKGSIGRGLMVLLGVETDDTEVDADYLAKKITGLRIFNDEAGKMNRSLVDSAGRMLVVSQFTLMGDCRKGRRPSFIRAAPPEQGERLYKRFVETVRGLDVVVETGVFGAMMEVSLVNDGPVTLIVESRRPV